MSFTLLTNIIHQQLHKLQITESDHERTVCCVLFYTSTPTTTCTNTCTHIYCNTQTTHSYL